MKIQHLIASVIAFLLVLLVGIYALHILFADLFPSGNVWVVYGVPELLGLLLAIAAAWYAGKMSAKMQATEK
jgi:uncharacterized membrane protein